MIRINLLPFRAARKKENIKRQISIFVLTTLFAFAAMGYVYIQLESEVAAQQARKAELKKKLTKYDKTLKELKKLKKKIREIRAKLKVIRDLEKKKTGPVKLLDQIATAVPKEKLWLRSLKEKKGRLTLQGTAMDNETVALFMTNLEASPLIRTVDLKNTHLKRIKKYKLNVTDFVLECKTTAFKKKKKRKAKGKARKRR